MDCRNEDEFSKWHITDSTNFPEYRLKQDKLIPELFRYKNKEDKIIIVYAFDEMTGMPVANLFFEKGFDNIYLLNGGLEKFTLKFPGLVDGTIPDPIKKKILKMEKQAQKEV